MEANLGRKMPVYTSLIILIDRLRNRLKLWNLSHIDRLASTAPESLSELDDYLTICKLASQDEEYFKKFRSCSSYRAILENVDGKSGLQLVRSIQKYGVSIEKFAKLWHTDVGRPYKYHIKGAGYVAPTELRYSKIIVELELLFGRLDGFSISEIGVGFGGQGGQILDTFDILEYEFIDLPEPLKLVNKYLQTIGHSDRVRFTPPEELNKHRRDLVISNYAFSELNRELQELYFESIIRESARGFVIYNHITPESYKTMSAEAFAARISGSQIFAENPLSHPGNVLIVWGHKGKLDQL